MNHFHNSQLNKSSVMWNLIHERIIRLINLLDRSGPKYSPTPKPLLPEQQTTVRKQNQNKRKKRTNNSTHTTTNRPVIPTIHTFIKVIKYCTEDIWTLFSEEQSNLLSFVVWWTDDRQHQVYTGWCFKGCTDLIYWHSITFQTSSLCLVKTQRRTFVCKVQIFVRALNRAAQSASNSVLVSSKTGMSHTRVTLHDWTDFDVKGDSAPH